LQTRLFVSVAVDEARASVITLKPLLHSAAAGSKAP
jgi:hypothetical protein